MNTFARKLHGHSVVRVLLIGYAVAALSFLGNPAAHYAPPDGMSTQMLLSGIAVQALVSVMRMLIRRYIDHDLAPQALLVIELVGDCATLLLFALATFGNVFELGVR